MMDKVNIIENLEELEGFLFREYEKAKDDIDTWYFRYHAVSDTLALLKEQEAIKPIYDEEKYGDHLPHCGNCEKVLPNNAVYGKVNFCHYCGRAVKRK